LQCKRPLWPLLATVRDRRLDRTHHRLEIAARQDGRSVAKARGLGERTVAIHRAKVMEKMGARSIAHLVQLHMTLADPG